MPDPEKQPACQNCQVSAPGKGIRVKATTPPTCADCGRVLEEIMAPAKPSPEDRLNRAWNQIVQFFPDALLLVRSDGGFKIKSTDATWCVGAAERYLAHVATGDQIESEKFFTGDDSGAT